MNGSQSETHAGPKTMAPQAYIPTSEKIAGRLLVSAKVRALLFEAGLR
jgi:hypothetical protein